MKIHEMEKYLAKSLLIKSCKILIEFIPGYVCINHICDLYYFSDFVENIEIIMLSRISNIKQIKYSILNISKRLIF